MEDLFSHSLNVSSRPDSQPLSEKARPQSFEDFVGQTEVINEGPRLKELVLRDQVPSLILWGPPGTGKTSFAVLVSKLTKAEFISRSAIDTGAKDLKQEGEDARKRLAYHQKRTVLFIDEIHRLNRAQQDCLLPYVERGDFTLIGATTENPSFEVNNALLSRCQVIVFKSLEEKEIKKVLDRGLGVLAPDLKWEDLSNESVKDILAGLAAGDARRSLNLLERIYQQFLLSRKSKLSKDEIYKTIQHVPASFDKSGEFHYNTISAFIKSIRGSDPDAALFYLARMLEGGEDPLFIARRLVILASEDVGNAEPRALMVAVAAKDAVEFVGLPEAAINLAQAVTFLASSPKSNRSYMGLRKAQAAVKENSHLSPPMNILNAPTDLMKSLGYGSGYVYDHDQAQGISKQSFLPEKIKDMRFYEPLERGSEKNIKLYLDWVKKIRQDLES